MRTPSARDFPIFEQRVHGKPLAYLDSAVTAQKPRQVLDALREFYATSYTNVHRGVYAAGSLLRSSTVPARCEQDEPSLSAHLGDCLP